MATDLLSRLVELMRSDSLWPTTDDVAGWTPGVLHHFKSRPGSTSCLFYTEVPGGLSGYFGEIAGDEWIFKTPFFIEEETPSARQAREQAELRLAARQREAEERAQLAQRAAVLAEALYQAGIEADTSNPYLARKWVTPSGVAEVGLKAATGILGYAPKRGDDRLSDPILVVPLFNAAGDLVNAEMIDGAGVKVPIYGGPRTGAFWATSPLEGAEIVGLAEGMATAQTIHELAHIPVVSVGGCGNFEATLSALKARLPRARFIVFADRGNGFALAERAANAHGAEIVAPPDGIAGSDFNDLMIECGDAAVLAVVEPVVSTAVMAVDGLPGAEAMLFRPRSALVKPDLDFVLPGLVSSSVGLIVGQGSIGKSFLAKQIALSLIFGDRLPWDFDDESAERVRPGKVGILLGEDDNTIIQSRYFDILNAFPRYKGEEYLSLMEKNLRIYGMPGEDMRIIEDIRGELAVGRFLDRLERFCEGKRAVFIDPLGKLLDGNENDNRIATRMMEKLVMIGRNTGCSPIVLHHVSKGGAGDREDWTAARGAGAITATARFQLNMRPFNAEECQKWSIDEEQRSSYVHLAVSKVNYGPRPAPFLLRRGPGGVLLPFSGADLSPSSFDAQFGAPSKSDKAKTFGGGFRVRKD